MLALGKTREGLCVKMLRELLHTVEFCNYATPLPPPPPPTPTPKASDLTYMHIILFIHTLT